MLKRMSYFNKLLLVIGLSAVVTFFAYVYFTGRTPRYYYIPKDYAGWVTIKFEKENAPALPLIDGAYHLVIPPSGILETSSKLENGWARDEHYWVGGGDTTLIPKKVDGEKEAMRYIHSQKQTCMSYDDIILGMENGTDTILWDGAKISKKRESADVSSGRNLLEHFFVSKEAQPFFYPHDTLPAARKIW